MVGFIVGGLLVLGLLLLMIPYYIGLWGWPTGWVVAAGVPLVLGFLVWHER